jgi:hypothetical protein
VVFRYNEAWNIEGTAFLALMGNHEGGECDNWQIYGNILGYTDDVDAQYTGPEGGIQNGVIANSSGDYATNCKIYNNTFINIWPNGATTGKIIGFDAAGSTGNAFRNNLIYNGDLTGGKRLVYNTGVHADSMSHNYYILAPFYNVAGTDSLETSIQKGTADPFTALATEDVSLTSQTEPGTTLTLFTTDLLGTSYTVSGSWTRGALAYDSGESGARDWYVDRSASGDGTGTEADPLQASQIADSLGTGDTLYDVTPDNVGANAYTVAVDSVRVNFKKTLDDNPVIVGGLKTIEPVNLAVVGDAVPDSVLVLSGNRDGEMRQPVGNIATVDFTGYTMDAGESTAGGVSTMFIQMHPSVSNYASMNTAYLRLSCAGTKTGTANMLVYAIKNVATPKDTTEAQATLASVSGSGVVWQIVNPASGAYYLSPNLASIINALDLANAGGDSVLFVITENGSGSAVYFRARTYENAGTDIDPELVYEYQ